jgi:CO dehydrogenase/acetyl-CoA synthase beta subunit
MNQFDQYISGIHREIDRLFAQGRHIRSVDVSGSPDDIIRSLPVRVGSGAAPGMILRSDTFAELGGPDTGSCNIVVCSSDVSLINNRRITLFGYDIADIEVRTPGYSQLSVMGNIHFQDSDHDLLKDLISTQRMITIPFGRIVIAGGSNMTENDFETLKNALIVADQIEGYMERNHSYNLWSRVSRDAVNRGFSLIVLGKAMIALILQSNPKLEAIEIAFVTTSRRHIDLLEPIAVQTRKIAKEISKERWKIKGYDIECVSDCDTCNDKPVCDDIRAMLKERKEQRSDEPEKKEKNERDK